MIPTWIIAKKRDGETLTAEEIKFFINGFTKGDIPDYQMSALLMAIYIRGMNAEETSCLTQCVIDSGATVDTSNIARPKVDKHSTGGIGDKVSLILAPLVASCGLAVPMISGRGLGITGGTLDKLEAIPGYTTSLSEQDFLNIVAECGCSIVSQTNDLAPADKKLYALRDVTGTVSSIPLITASIMGKKMAAGLDSLVLDVKVGRGAFMQTIDDARELAQNMVTVGQAMGKNVTAIITDMNSPLGYTVGNSVEIREVIECLHGNGADDLMEVTLRLAQQMLLMGGVVATATQADQMLQEKLTSGEAFATFKTMVERQGGDPKTLDKPDLLPTAKLQQPYPAKQRGFIAGVDAQLVGKASLLLGAGRLTQDDQIDHAVGITGIKKIGEPIQVDEPLAIIHDQNQQTIAKAVAMLENAFTISEIPVQKHSRILEICH